MSVNLLKSYNLGDMTANYFLDDEENIAELMLSPIGEKIVDWDSKVQKIDPIIALKIMGDKYSPAYAQGATMLQSESSFSMKYDRQEVTETDSEIVIKTICKDERGYEAVHFLTWKRDAEFLLSKVSFTNKSDSVVALEKLDSFHLSGISTMESSDASESLILHRIRSVWSMEGRLVSEDFEDLQLEPSWALGHAIRCERFGGIGSLNVNKFFPYMVIEDSKNHLMWGAQLAHNASWQMEVFRRDESASISGGLGDREFAHWYKNVAPKETFTTPIAILTVAKDLSIDQISQRLTSAQTEAANNGPESEQDLPVIFNEYCTTWGCPSHENITGIVDAIKDKGFSYFVIDCGWFKADGIPWDVSMGDYVPSKTLFPEGMHKTVDLIKKAGMKPGIWFEINNVGKEAEAYHDEDHLLKRDGQVLTTGSRRFKDMRKPEVIEELTEKVIGTLNQYGFEYMKIDDNDNVGIGCDGAESLGEGLRQDMEGAVEFLRKVKREVPGIILENCASGGHRLEPLMMTETSMASFSDAHECPEIPIIAANLHRVILPRQSQIWCVIRETDDLKRIAYSIANTFLGRMCLSGDVTNLSKEQWDVIDRGIAFYKQVATIIRDGESEIHQVMNKSYRHPKGYQYVLRKSDEGILVVVHTFDGNFPDKITIKLPENHKWNIKSAYSDRDVEARIEDNNLIYKNSEDFRAAAFYIKEQ